MQYYSIYIILDYMTFILPYLRTQVSPWAGIKLLSLLLLPGGPYHFLTMETCLSVMNTQYTIQMMCCGIVDLKPV